MKLAQLAADLQQLSTIHGPDVEVLFVDHATGARWDLDLIAAIAPLAQASGPAKATVFIAVQACPMPQAAVQG